MSKFHIICSPDYTTSFLHCDDNGVASVFDTEVEATAAAKDYAPAIVVKAVTMITEVTKYKVTKLA